MTDTIDRPVESTELPEPEKHMLSIADPTGDNRVMWDPRIEDEVKVAREAFHKAQKKGMLAYTVKDDGEKGEVIREFDPQAGKIIMTKQLVGG